MAKVELNDALNELEVARRGGFRNIAFLGDSITMYANTSGAIPSPSTLGSYLSFDCTELFTPAGAGTLTWSNAAKTLTWAAPGESAGSPVLITKSGLYLVPSSTAKHGLRVVVRYGDMPVSDFTQKLTVASLAQMRHNSYGYPTWAHILSDAGFDYTTYGAGGSASADIAPIADVIIAAGAYDAVIDLTGINDVGGNISLDSAWASMLAMYTKLVSSGIPVLSLSITPRGAGTSVAQTRVLQALNRKKRELQVVLPGFYHADIFQFMADPTDTTGAPAANMTADGVHHLALAAYWAGKAVASWLGSRTLASNYSVSADAFSAANNPNGNMLTQANIAFGGTAGTIGAGASGELGTGWSAARNTGSSIVVACSKVNRTGGRLGQMQRLDVSGATASFENVVVSSLNAVSVTPGNTMKAAIGVQVSNMLKARQVELQLTWLGVGGNYSAIGNSYTNQFGWTHYLPDGENWSGVIETPNIEVPPGATTASLKMLIGTDAGGTATVDVSWAFIGNA